MRINVRRHSYKDYAEVTLFEDNIQIDLGLLDSDERKALAAVFQEAVDELLHELAEDEEFDLEGEEK